MPDEARTDKPEASQSKVQTRVKSKITRKMDSYKSDTKNIVDLAFRMVDSTAYSYRSDKKNIVKRRNMKMKNGEE